MEKFSKKELNDYVSNYKTVQKKISELYTLLGPVVDSPIFTGYEGIIHNLLVKMYGDLGADLLEEYMFEQIDMDFDTIYDILINKDYDPIRIRYTDSE